MLVLGLASAAASPSDRTAAETAAYFRIFIIFLPLRSLVFCRPRTDFEATELLPYYILHRQELHLRHCRCTVGLAERSVPTRLATRAGRVGTLPLCPPYHDPTMVIP